MSQVFNFPNYQQEFEWVYFSPIPKTALKFYVKLMQEAMLN